MKENIMTKVSEGIYQHFDKFDEKIKNYTGDLPYGVKKMTPRDRRERIESLRTVQDMASFIKAYGREAVEEELRKYYEGRI